MIYQIGIDLGATKTNLVLMEKLRLIETRKVLTPKEKGELIAMLKRNILELALGRKIEKIGLGVPGPLNEKRDLILNPPNLTCLKNFPLAKVLQKNLKIKIRMGNDANCFTLGEAWLGAGRNSRIILGITLGSGVGGGLVIKSKKPQIDYLIYWGAFGAALEVGHQIIKFDGEKCNCQNIGCWEEYTSERFFKRKNLTPLKAQKLAQKGDFQALEIFKEYGKYLGVGLANLVNLFDPEIIILGGGIMKASRYFLKMAQKEMKTRILSPLSRKNVKIKKAQLGDWAGAIGATFLE